MMMKMNVLNKQQHISYQHGVQTDNCICQSTGQKRNFIMVHWHVDCCLIGIVLGVKTTKNIFQYQYYPIPVNAQYPITQYQYRSNPTFLSAP